MPWEFYCVIGGVVLLIIELAVPGFGVFGIGGTLFLTIGCYYLMGGGMTALLTVVAFYAVLAAVLAVLCLYLPRESKWNPFVLWDRQKNSAGYTGGENLALLLGKRGETLTTLRPAGTIIADGRRLDVSSLGDYVEKGVPVQIVKVEGSKIFVDRIKE